MGPFTRLFTLWSLVICVSTILALSVGMWEEHTETLARIEHGCVPPQETK